MLLNGAAVGHRHRRRLVATAEDSQPDGAAPSLINHQLPISGFYTMQS